MELTVLGHNGPYPGPDGGACSGYLVKAGEEHILLDCGSGILSRLYRHADVTDLSAVVLSHLHGDHISDMLVLRYALMLKNADILPVYTPDQPEGEYWILSQSSSFETTAVVPGYSYEVGDATLEFVPMTHPFLNYAVKITHDGKTLVYSGDTTYNDVLPRFAAHADLLVCDSAFTEAAYFEKAPHASAKQAGMMANQAHAKRLLLTHYMYDADTDMLLAEAKSQFRHVAVAQKNLTIQL